MTALKRASWTAAPAETQFFSDLRVRDPKRFLDILTAARAEGDVQRYLCLARILRRAGALSPKHARHLRGYLVWAQEFGEALEIIGDPALFTRDSSEYWLRSAQIMAGVGRLANAADAAETALSLAPDDAEIVRFAGIIRTITRLRAQAATQTSWPDIEQLLAGYKVVGRLRDALPLLRDLARNGAPLDPAASPNVIRLLTEALQEAPAESAIRCLLELSKLLPPDYARLAHCARDVILGRRAEPLAAAVPGLSDDHFRRFLANVCAAGGKLEIAIQDLGKLAAQRRSTTGVYDDLAAYVGRNLLSQFSVEYVAPRERRCFDLFPFNGEYDLLQIKLEEMSSWIDHFILVESPVTFTGLPKPLYFAEAKDRFAKFLPKIIHVVADEFPPFVDSAWAREFHQRDSAIKGLSGLCAPDDLVLLSDADEVVRRDAIDGFKGTVAGLRLRTYRYFLNYQRSADSERRPSKTGLIRAKDLQFYGGSYARFGLPRARKAYIDDAGWHFTSIADAAGLAAKLRSYSHQENVPVSEQDLADTLQSIRAGHLEPGWTRRDIDDSFPGCIRENRDLLQKYIL